MIVTSIPPPRGLLMVKRLYLDHAKTMGSVVTDGNKNIVSAVTYHPFGEPHTKEGEESYLFTGKEKDSTGPLEKNLCTLKI
jgi:hypothetical protein